VAIARALINNPRVIFADEPTASLDRDNGQKVVKLLRSYCKKNNAILIMVSHSPEMIEGFGRRFKVENGQVSEVTANV